VLRFGSFAQEMHRKSTAIAAHLATVAQIVLTSRPIRNPIIGQMNELVLASLKLSTPILVLLVTALIAMLFEVFGQRKLLPLLTVLGLSVSALLSLPTVGLVPPARELGFSGMMSFGGYSAFTHVFLCIVGIASLFFIDDFLRRHNQDIGEIYALLLFTIIGMVILATGNHLAMLFIGLEIMSVCLYILAAIFKRDHRSNEAGMKYFLLGAFASGFLLYGIALLYGLSGTMRLDHFRFDLYLDNPMLYAGLGLVLIGFLFKVAAFPFHAWTPDVYTGAPTPLAGFMATGSKLSAFVALAAILLHALPSADVKLVQLLVTVALISMVYGNFVAAQQSNLKRMLAYSSIAHSGYLLLGLASGPAGYVGVSYYMLIYSLMTIGAFGIISLVENESDDAEGERWKGLGFRQPALAVLMACFMFSLAGIPPFGGFMAKYYVFKAAVDAGWVWPAVLGILTSVVGAYYYLRVLVLMYFRQPEGSEVAQAVGGEGKPGVSAYGLSGAGLLVLALLILGILPSLVYEPLQSIYAIDFFPFVAQR
jgi:NADH-quinone oxidoreductase subunit N